VKKRFLAIVNPQAGGGRCGKLASDGLIKLRTAGVLLDVIATTAPGHATELAGEAYSQGYRRFIAVGGDGTAHEILNGVFPRAFCPGTDSNCRISLGFLPLGTGNSFVRDFATPGADEPSRALIEGRFRPCDIIRITHAAGEIYSLNLASVGFTADVAALANRAFKSLGQLGYLFGVLVSLARLRRRAFPFRCDANPAWDHNRYLFLSFNNSKFTGGKMMIAPYADATDGALEIVRWGPIGRFGLIRTLPRLFDGTHIEHPLASHLAARKIHFDIDHPEPIMIDGEVFDLKLQSMEILRHALDVYV
jgi:diacylglycerol kinase (ATP)